MPLTSEHFAALYAQHAQPLVAYFARRVYDPEIAVDLMAETFASAFASRASFRDDPSRDDQANRWLYGIARNALAQYWRAGHVERRATAQLGVERRALTDAELERIDELADLSELRRRLPAELAALPADHAEVLQLRIVDELDYPVIAARLGITEQNARARVSRSLRTLATRLAPYRPAEEGSHA